MSETEDAPIKLLDQEPQRLEFLQQVLAGLDRPQRELPCKFLYDERGAALFDRICELPSYYLTRTELAIMTAHGAEMARLCGRRCALVEFGAGSSIKVRLLLDRLEDPVAFVPIDISREHLARAAAALAIDYPRLRVLPVCADYTGEFRLPALPRLVRRTVVYFPGSTIGNFARGDAGRFLERIAALCGPDGALLIGVDLKKDRAILDAAYNDPEGVTAEFNLNLLRHINRELDADFDLDQFRHEAIYNEPEGRVEMYLVSLAEQAVHLGGRTLHIARGERICTEWSCKYDPDEFVELARAAGFEPVKRWTDDAGMFGVFLAER